MIQSKVTPELVKALRDRTGVAVGKCKEALDETGGDMEKAIDVLRKKGIASAAKKEGRETKEGVVVTAETSDAIALVEINVETDFVAENDKFKQFAQAVAHQAVHTKPASLEAFLAQPSPQDKSITLDQARALLMQSLGENIKIKRLEIFPKSSKQSFGMYSHMRGKIVTLVEIDGGAGHEHLAKEIAMHIAAEDPDYLKPEDVPADIKQREEEIAREQVKGKPPQIVDKIVEGKMKAFYVEKCLLCQPFVKDSAKSVQDLVTEEGKKAGRPLTLKRFVRWEVGR